MDLSQLVVDSALKVELEILNIQRDVEVIITKDVEIFQLTDSPDSFEPCKMDDTGRETIWKYEVPYDDNGMPCCYEGKKPETMRELFTQVFSEVVQEKIKKKELAMEVVAAEPVRENDTIHYDPMMEDTFA